MSPKRTSSTVFILGAAVLVGALVLLVKNSGTPDVPQHIQARTHVQAKKLKPICKGSECSGSYVYQSPDLSWWYYNYAFSATQSTTSAVANPSSLPSGGAWVKSAKAPEKSEIDEEAKELELTENENGVPVEEVTTTVSETEVVAEEPTPEENQVAEAPTESVSSVESVSSDTGSSDAGSSDSGSSGGDSGGGSD